MFENYKPEFPVSFDLNEREVERFAEFFREFAKASNELAASIEKNDNREIMGNFLVLTIMLNTAQEFKNLVVKTLLKQREKEDFPEFIKNE